MDWYSPNDPCAEPCWVYALADPRDGSVRYVGCTLDLKVRMNYHRTAGRLPAHKRTPIADWVADLLSLGMEPRLEVLEETVRGQRRAREHYWLHRYSREGAQLFNVQNVHPYVETSKLVRRGLWKVERTQVVESSDFIPYPTKRIYHSASGANLSGQGRKQKDADGL